MARIHGTQLLKARMGFVVLTGLALALVGTGVPMQAQTSITSCPYTITAPGTYVLGADLGPCAAEGILIEASSVLLTLNGHTITGSLPGATVGIGVPAGLGLSGITIQGPGYVRNFNAGIAIHNADNIQVSKVTSANNVTYDLVADTVTGLVLTQNVLARNGGVGLYLNGSTNGMVQHNDISGNAASGIVLTGGGSGNLVENNIVNGNNADGILITENGDQIRSNTTNGNQNSGIHVAAGAGGNQILRNTSEGSSTGFDLEDDNASCGTNSWRKDTFFTSNAACIQ